MPRRDSTWKDKLNVKNNLNSQGIYCEKIHNMVFQNSTFAVKVFQELFCRGTSSNYFLKFLID